MLAPLLWTTAAATAAALLLPRVALAATCNPTNSSQFPCTPNPGLCKSSFSTDFTSGQNTSWSMTYGSVDYTSSGAEFTIAKQGDAPTMQTDFYIWYGKVAVTMKSAPGQGIISSIVLESDDYDEIDWVSLLLPLLGPSLVRPLGEKPVWGLGAFMNIGGLFARAERRKQ